MTKLILIWIVYSFFHTVLALPQDLQTNLDPKIIGGHNAKPGQFPYQVSYQWGILGIFIHMCGGIIITPSWILTAAHCILDEYPIGDFRIVAGTVHSFLIYGDKAQFRKVVEKIPHPNFGESDVGPNDIALLRLEKALEFTDFVQAIALPEAGTEPVKANATLSGWGDTQNLIPIPPLILKTVDMPILNDAACKEDLDSVLDDPDNNPYSNSSNTCTGPLTGGVGACFGDSGGPLTQDGKVIGIVSWVKVPCASVGAVTVYTQVSNFIDFIHEHVTDL